MFDFLRKAFSRTRGWSAYIAAYEESPVFEKDDGLNGNERMEFFFQTGRLTPGGPVIDVKGIRSRRKEHLKSLIEQNRKSQ